MLRPAYLYTMIALQRLKLQGLAFLFVLHHEDELYASARHRSLFIMGGLDPHPETVEAFWYVTPCSLLRSADEGTTLL
jgi:hypothetical protein